MAMGRGERLGSMFVGLRGVEGWTMGDSGENEMGIRDVVSLSDEYSELESEFEDAGSSLSSS